MAKRSRRPKDTLQADLSDRAEALRQSRLAGREAERTTLNIADPKRQAGAVPPPDTLGEALVDRGLLTRHQLFNALNESYARNCTLREALLALELVDAETLTREGL